MAAAGAVANDFKIYDNIFIEPNILSTKYDGVVLILYPEDSDVKLPRHIQSFIAKALDFDKCVKKVPTVWNCEYVSGGRLILAPTGKITPYHDSKILYNAAKRGMQRALDAGVTKPLLVVQNSVDFPEGRLVSILGAMEVLYVPLQARELKNEKLLKVNILGIHAGEDVQADELQKIVKNSIILERSRILTRDIAGGDPERMSPKNIAEYVKNEFASNSNITIKIVEDLDAIKKDYPLLFAVSRAANTVERHKPRVVEIVYTPTDVSRINETVMLVGKGVTYDTGGADVKISGAMIGMSRDKCGAAAVAGFLKACSLFKPPHLKVIGVLCLCRNSIGEESYVADELLVSRSGKTVRVTNTDAEGRFAMADALFDVVEKACVELNPHIYTIATLTGHARRSYGDNTAAMDNHSARATGHASRMQLSGSKMAEGIEVSVIRNEDLEMNRGKAVSDDLVQIDMKATRHHQVAAGFLILISGLDEKNVKYTHLDIAGAAGSLPDEPTAVPLLTLCHVHKVLM